MGTKPYVEHYYSGDYNKFDYDLYDLKYLLIAFGLSILVLIPIISLMVRRLHDIGLSGLFVLFIFFAPFSLALFCIMCSDSYKGANKYGPPTKYIIEEEPLLPENDDIPQIEPIYQNPQFESEIVNVTPNLGKNPNESQTKLENNSDSEDNNSLPPPAAFPYYSSNENINLKESQNNL